MTLYFASHFTRLECRDPRVSICRCYLHLLLRRTRRSLLRHLAGMGTMFLKGSGRRKFAQLMANHVLSHKHRIKYLAVMHQERVTHKVRSNHRSARPSLNGSLGTGGIGHFLDLFEKLGVHEWTFF